MYLYSYAKWDKGFKECGHTIFRKEDLRKLNIMKLVCVELSTQRYLYSSLESRKLEEKWAENGIEI